MPMPQIIQVEKKTKYGSEFLYPVNEQAHKAAALWQQKTITPINIERLKHMGFIVELVVLAGVTAVKVSDL